MGSLHRLRFAERHGPVERVDDDSNEFLIRHRGNVLLTQVEERAAIPGSEVRHEDGGTWLPAAADQHVSPTVVIRRPPTGGMRADPADWTAVLAFAEEFGLTVSNEKPEARMLHVEGSLAQIGKAFGVEVQQRVDAQGRSYLSYQGSLTLPRPLEGIVEAVLGLDQRPIARPRGAQ